MRDTLPAFCACERHADGVCPLLQTAKAAVIRYTKSAGVMYAPENIRMNCVVPGLMYTPLVENFGASENEEDREVFRRITEHNVPMKKMVSSPKLGHAIIRDQDRGIRAQLTFTVRREARGTSEMR